MSCDEFQVQTRAMRGAMARSSDWMAGTIKLPMTEAVATPDKCPNCNKALEPGTTYRCGYSAINFRTIPPTYGVGQYCVHKKEQ